MIIIALLNTIEELIFLPDADTKHFPDEQPTTI